MNNYNPILAPYSQESPVVSTAPSPVACVSAWILPGQGSSLQSWITASRDGSAVIQGRELDDLLAAPKLEEPKRI
jgi:hypothetical protein